MSDTPLKLNLGAGGVSLGNDWTSIDLKNGKSAYPLECEDGTVDEIYASHLLEHFSHTATRTVLTHWVTKLKPGGRIRIAVPDFAWIAEQYGKGEPINTQGYAMGGHTDKDDIHGAIFDRESLLEDMLVAGLERIHDWKSEVQDCAALAVSLNLQGFKPTSDVKVIKANDVAAVLSAPRYGPMLHTRCAHLAFGRLNIPYMVTIGAYWQQVLTNGMEEVIDRGCKYVLTMDYDTVFNAHDVLALYRIMESLEYIDAVCPLQSKRGSKFPLFGIVDKDGKPKGSAHASEFIVTTQRVLTGHFGCTMFRVESLKKCPRPWFAAKPDDDGSWGEGKVDPDIGFWYNWRDAGLQLHLANHVVVGHIQEMITWPSHNLSSIYQSPAEYDVNGIPADTIRVILEEPKEEPKDER